MITISLVGLIGGAVCFGVFILFAAIIVALLRK